MKPGRTTTMIGSQEIRRKTLPSIINPSDLELRRAVAEAGLIDAQLVEQRQHEVRHRRVRRNDEMAIAFQLP